MCEASGFCSFPDTLCPSTRRYGEHAGSGLAGTCVPQSDETGEASAGTGPTSTTTATTADTLDPSATSGAQSTSSTSASTSADDGTCPLDEQCRTDADCPGAGTCIACTCIGDATTGTNQTCEECQIDAGSAGGACYQYVVACEQDPDCVDVFECLEANMCRDEACYNACYMASPGGVAGFEEYLLCLFGRDGTGGACGDVCR
jgi:hypothetical protein